MNRRMATNSPAPPNPPDKISMDEIRELMAQKLAIDFLKYQKENEPAPHKSKWLQVLESAGFAAIVTVGIGGIFGTYITNKVQDKAKERENETARSQLIHDRQLAAFNEHIERQRKLLDEMSLLLGTHIQSTVDLEELSQAEWNTRHTSQERIQIKEQYNDTAQKWESNRTRLGLQFQLENNNDSHLYDSWERIGDQLASFGQCAYRTQLKHKDYTHDQAQQACETFRNSLEAAIQDFTGSIISLNTAAAGSMK